MGHWTISELAERTAAALTEHGHEPGSDTRARHLPDPRTIRWYQTTGLLDRPTDFRGRTALYGERHLAQLLAIKRLQAEGRSLAAIQAALAGIPDRTLRQLAGLPCPSAPSDAVPASTSRRFWSRTETSDSPTLAPPRVPTDRAAAPDGTAPSTFHRRDADQPSAATGSRPDVRGIRLRPDVLLLLDGGRAPSAADVEALRRAADPLLAELVSRNLVKETE